MNKYSKYTIIIYCLLKCYEIESSIGIKEKT